MNNNANAGRWPVNSDRFIRQLIAAFLILTLNACGGSGGDADSGQCNASAQKQWAYDSMRDFYLFYDQVPIVDPQAYSSANELVRSVRFEERDDFSRVSDSEQSALEFDQGREFGLGYSWSNDEDDNARISHVVSDSPFGRVGIERGDLILSVDGLGWKDNALFANFSERVFGTPSNPSTSTWSFEKRDTGQIVTMDIMAAEYDINTVLKYEAYTNSELAGTTGYLAFSRFLNTSESELNDVFGYFQDQNITELVLDLRYNGGGRVSIARQLAGLIAGSSEFDQPIYDYRFNDKYSQKNFTLDFQNSASDLGLSRVIVLTSDRTASSSEIVIAGLQPYIDVVTIGTATRGKPYIQYAYDRCGERLAVIEAEGFNAAGNSVFGGVPALCYAEDDLTRGFGLGDDEQFEGMLKTGIDYIATGACNTEAIAIAPRILSKQAAADERSDSRQGISNRGGALLDKQSF